MLWVEIEAEGKTAHGSVPYKGINAFEKICAVAAGLKRLELETLGKKRTRHPVPEERQALPTIMVGGVVRGGLKTNVVPDACMVTVDRRLIPEESIAEAAGEIEGAVEDLRARDPDLKVTLTRTLAIEPSVVDAGHEITRATAAAHEQVYGQKPKIVVSSGFFDAHYFTRGLGIPTISYGPGQLGTAHAPDEYIVVDDLVKSTQVLAQVVADLLA